MICDYCKYFVNLVTNGILNVSLFFFLFFFSFSFLILHFLASFTIYKYSHLRYTTYITIPLLIIILLLDFFLTIFLFR